MVIFMVHEVSVESEAKPIRQFVMMIGLPGAGKSTYVREHIDSTYKGFTLLSTGQVAKQVAEEIKNETGKNVERDFLYTDPEQRRKILKRADARIQDAISRGDNILLDCTGKADLRQLVLDMCKTEKNYNYETTAVLIHPKEEKEHLDGLWQRAVNKISFLHCVLLISNHALSLSKKVNSTML
jgi:predicted kinase